MASFELAIDHILRNEGGYVNDPNDRGGETKYGISSRAYPRLDIKNLTCDQARGIYRDDYWDPIMGDHITSQVAALSLFDFAVNAGVRTAIRMVQMTTGAVPLDGRMGPISLRAINHCSDEQFLTAFTVAKIARYVSIVDRNRSQEKFLYGWVRRSLRGLPS